MKKKKIIICSILCLLIIGFIIFMCNVKFLEENIKISFNSNTKSETSDVTIQNAQNSNGDIYDVILFFGQSNMVGYTTHAKETRFDPKNITSVENFSKISGISKDILKNVGEYRDQVKTVQQLGTAYIYKYSTNSFEEITTSISEAGEQHIGESLFREYDSNGKLKITTEYKEVYHDGVYTGASECSQGLNIIPQFCQTYYNNTGHKVIAVMNAVGGVPIDAFVPENYTDSSVSRTYKLYEPMVEQWNSAINLLKEKNLTIGNKSYVVFQGENTASKSDYKNKMKIIDESLRNNLGIAKGVLIETSHRPGEANMMSRIEEVHQAKKELVAESNGQIIMGSSFSYDRYVGSEEEYNNGLITRYDENGTALSYTDALARCRAATDYYTSEDGVNDNSMHFTSAALSQIGLETAEALSKIKQISITTEPTKKQYIQNYEKIDTTGGKLKITYNELQDDTIDITANMISGFDNSKLGTQTLTVSYKGKTATYSVQVNAKQISKIEIGTAPNKTAYIQNYEKLDVTGGKIKVTYNDTSTEIIQLTADMVSGFDNSKLGNRTLTVTYGGKTTTYTVQIIAKFASKIEMQSIPTKISYVQNYEKLDVTGGKIKITYSDTSTDIINITNDMVSGFDNSKLGNQTLTVTYGGKTTTYTIQVNAKQISKIEMETVPTKTTYIQSYEKLDVTGGKIKVIYNDTSTEMIKLIENMVSGFDNSKLGNQTLTVTYGGKTTTYTIQINKKQISKIELETVPVKITYIQNYEELNVKGGKIKITYSDTSTDIINITNEMVSGFDNSKLGNQTLTVTYGGKTTTYTIQVNAKQISKIEMETLPAKTTYIQNYEKLNVTGGKIKATYNDTSTEMIQLTANMVSGFDNSKLGNQTLTVTYGGKTTTYTIQVNAKQISKIEMETVPTKTAYIQSYEKLDVTGGKIKAIYNDTSTEMIQLTASMVSGFDNSKLGNQTLTVTYKGKTTTYTIQINKKQIIKIEMETVPTKITYIQNYEELNVKGGKIKITYNDASTEIMLLTANMVSGFDNSKLGSQTLTVTYGEKTTTYAIQINAKQISKIEMETVPTKTTYIQNYEKLDVTGGKIKVIYNDTSTDIVNMTDEMISGFDNSQIGKKALIVTYEGKTTTYIVQIKEKVIDKVDEKDDIKDDNKNDTKNDISNSTTNTAQNESSERNNDTVTNENQEKNTINNVVSNANSSNSKIDDGKTLKKLPLTGNNIKIVIVISTIIGIFGAYQLIKLKESKDIK